VWPGTIEDIMEGLTERIVGRSDDPDAWEYSTWLNLTPKGQLASDDVVRQRSDRRSSAMPPVTELSAVCSILLHL
jgi:hypothetical protein